MVAVSRLSERRKYYVEAVYKLAKQNDYARTSDLADTLDVKVPSVTSMLQKLYQQNLVDYKPFKGATLTPNGKLLAEAFIRRHQIVKKILIMMGINEEQAEKDAYKIKHKLDNETMDRLASLVDFVESASQIPPIFRHFEIYCNAGERPEQCGMKRYAKKD
jgi:DtxR family Mn-dependent transcriptional regulator